MHGRPLAAVVSVLILGGCPHRSPYPYGELDGDGGVEAPDAATITPVPELDAAPRPDARPGGTMDGGTGPGGIADFPPCVTDSDCASGSDCRPIPWISNEKQCIPRCDASFDCPFHTFCYPAGGGALGPSFALMGDHCWFSLCGEAFGPTGGSETGGPCQLGAEASVPISDQLPGWCMPIDDQYFGQCLEVGGVAPGGSCDFASPTRSGANCNASGICIGSSGAATGTCQRLCSPQWILTGDSTGCTAAGEDCLDVSRLSVYNDGSAVRGTIGYCTAHQACGLIGPNPCAPSATGEAQGCIPTNAVRPTGTCDPAGTGALTAGLMCPLVPGGDSTECVHGTLCNGGAGGGTCQTICQLDHSCMGPADCPHAMTCTGYTCTLPYGTGPDAACPGGTTCAGVFYDAGFDLVPGTLDDVYTFDWGTCQ